MGLDGQPRCCSLQGQFPSADTFSRLLLGSGDYQLPVVLSAIFVGATVVSGIQDGIAQGFEIFGTIAKLKIVASLLTLASIYPMASQFGLVGVLITVLGGLAVKYLILERLIFRSRSEADIPKSGRAFRFEGSWGDLRYRP